MYIWCLFIYMYTCALLFALGNFYVKNKVDIAITERVIRECLENSADIYGDDGKCVRSV